MKYAETTRFMEAGATAMRIFVLSLFAILGAILGIVDGVVVYSLIMNAPGQGWVLPAGIYLLVVIIGPTVAGTWRPRKGRHLGRSNSIQMAIVMLFAGSVAAACILLPVFSM